MEEINVTSNEEFMMRLRKTLNQWSIGSNYQPIAPSTILYRGQPNSDDKLETTLERSSNIISARDYLSICLRSNSYFEAEVERKYDDISRSKIEEWASTIDRAVILDLPWMDYLTYLRHHGFPSPFLDWTQSLHIALGFAFFDESRTTSQHDKMRSVFLFIERPSRIKGGSFGEPEIRQIGPYIKTDKRHFLQQSNYTICYKRVENDINFCKYDSVVNKFGDNSQDLLYKYNIPESERGKIIHLLFSMNITPYSLMPSKESLMKTLWLKEHVLHNYEHK